MSGKIDSLKEKFRLSLTSTAKVISDDFQLINKSSEITFAVDVKATLNFSFREVSLLLIKFEY